MEFIIKGKAELGKTRSEHEVQLRKEWGQTITDEQLNKLKYMERKLKDRTGSERNFIKPQEIDKVK